MATVPTLPTVRKTFPYPLLPTALAQEREREQVRWWRCRVRSTTAVAQRSTCGSHRGAASPAHASRKQPRK